MSINKWRFTRVICEISLEVLKDLNSGTCRVCFLKGGGHGILSIDQTSTEDDGKIPFPQSPTPNPIQFTFQFGRNSNHLSLLDTNIRIQQKILQYPKKGNMSKRAISLDLMRLIGKYWKYFFLTTRLYIVIGNSFSRKYIAEECKENTQAELETTGLPIRLFSGGGGTMKPFWECFSESFS